MDSDNGLNSSEQNLNRLLPQPLRCLVVGASSTGKSTLLFNIMHRKWGVSYENLIIFSKELFGPFYTELMDEYEKFNFVNSVTFLNEIKLIPKVENCASNTLVVFDKCSAVPQKKIIEYFFHGKYNNISVAYSSLSFARVNNQIKNSFNCVFVFKQDLSHMKTVYNYYAANDFTLTEFVEICRKCWNETCVVSEKTKNQYGFLTIFIEKTKNNGRYFNNLKEELLDENIDSDTKNSVSYNVLDCKDYRIQRYVTRKHDSLIERLNTNGKNRFISKKNNGFVYRNLRDLEIGKQYLIKKFRYVRNDKFDQHIKVLLEEGHWFSIPQKWSRNYKKEDIRAMNLTSNTVYYLTYYGKEEFPPFYTWKVEITEKHVNRSRC